MIDMRNIKPTAAPPDITMDVIQTSNWTIIEVHSAIICACLITLKPLLVKILPARLVGRAARAVAREQKQAEIAINYDRPPTVGTRQVRLALNPLDTITSGTGTSGVRSSVAIPTRPESGAYFPIFSNTDETYRDGHQRYTGNYKLADIESQSPISTKSSDREAESHRNRGNSPVRMPDRAYVRAAPSCDSLAQYSPDPPGTGHRVV
jgi:hypothetical protein